MPHPANTAHTPATNMPPSAPDLCCMKYNKVIVAGASSGIGLETAQQLAAAGAAVTITGRNPEKLAKAAESGLKAVNLDSRDRAALAAFFAAEGAFDHLVVSLSGNKGIGDIATLSLDTLKDGFEQKFWPVLNTVQAALPYVGKSITLVTAISSIARLPGTSGLGAINGGLEIMARVWARELKPLRVNTVSPGVIDSPWWDFMPAEAKAQAFEHYAGQIPMGRVGTPADVAGAIRFLVENEYVTGQVIACDGGLA